MEVITVLKEVQRKLSDKETNDRLVSFETGTFKKRATHPIIH